METAVIVAILGVIEGIGCSVIGLIVKRNNADSEEYRAKREADEKKAKEVTKASIDLQFSMADCLDVLLRKAHGDNLNGEVEEARQSLKKAKGELNSHANTFLANSMH